MKTLIRNAGLLLLLAIVCAPLAAASEFPRVKAKTFAKDKFVFPADLDGQKLNVLFLAMTADQDRGEYLQQALLDWQAALDEQNVFNSNVKAWHFPVLSGPPFFVKGLITNAMRDAYEGKIELSRGAVLFVDELDDFARDAGLVVDDEATIVITDANAQQLQTFKGDLTAEGAAEVAAAIGRWLADAN